ncbi:MAG: EAL domain-containing protein [Acholeplasmatales bacterium]|nr:EAL domain-containing protein [Acholeplasmatales bacterium]
MAKLSEILNLNKTKASINKIDLFLESSEKNGYEYIMALCFKAEIIHELGNTNEALKLIYPYTADVAKMENRSVIALYNAIIKICTDVERYDQVNKYIELKKGYLPISSLSAYTKDKINLALKTNDLVKAREYLEEYLSDDISKEEAISAKESLASIYYYERSFDEYINILPQLETYYKENLMFDKLLVLHFNLLYIDYSKEKYTKVIFEGKDFLKEANDNVLYSIKASTLLIKSYLAYNNVKQASIIVSNLDDVVGEQYLDDSIDFLYAAKATYARLQNTDAIKDYSDRIQALEQIKNPAIKEKKKEKVKEVKRKESYEDIVIPTIDFNKEQEIKIEMPEVNYRRNILNPKPKEEIIQTQEVIKKINSKKTFEVVPEFKTLENVLEALTNKNPNLKFRELFRLTCIEIAKAFKIDEIYLLYEKKGFKGLQFKKDRAYDKKLNVSDIEKTPNYVSYLQDTEIFSDDTDRTYNINIVNGEEYSEGTSIYSFPLHNEYGPIGSISYVGIGNFMNEGLAFESIKIINGIINTRLMIYLNQEKLERDNNRTFFLINNMNSGIKEEMDGYIHLNESAVSILGTIPELRREDYIYNIDSNYQIEYRNLVDEISYSLEKGRSIEYKYRKDNDYVFVKETFYPEIVDGDLWLTSLIDDISAIKNKEDVLKDLAYKNPISNMNTEVKLIDDLKLALELDHLTLAVIEIQDFEIFRELYGYNLQSQIIKFVGIELNKAIENDFKYDCYHLERDRFVILMRNIVDKRAVESKLTNILNSVSTALYKKNNRFSILFNAGVYRMGKGVTNIDTNTILGNALDALNDTYILDSKENHIAHFNGELNKQRFLENEKVNAISEALDTSKIALYYQQIVDIETKSVLGYYINPSHESYEIEYSLMESIAKRKNLIKRFDKYVIDNAMKEMKMIKTEFKSFITVFIPIHEEAFDGTLAPFILKRLEYYKINPNALVILCDNIKSIEINYIKSLGIGVATRNILDLFDGKANYLFYDYHKANFDSIKDMSYIASKYGATMILDEINSPEEIKACLANHYRYVYGRQYKKKEKIKGLLEKFR